MDGGSFLPVLWFISILAGHTITVLQLFSIPWLRILDGRLPSFLWPSVSEVSRPGLWHHLLVSLWTGLAPGN